MPSLPTNPAPNAATFSSFTPTLMSQAHSLKQQVRSRGGHRWKLNFSYKDRNRQLFAPIIAFLAQQRGQYNSFTTILPGYDTPQGTWPGAPVGNGSQSAGSRTLNVKGLTAGQTGIAKAGDFIKLASHTKVYMVCADANSDGSGLAALTIEPGLQQAIIDSDALTTTAVPFTVALTSDEFTPSLTPPVFHALEIAMIERP